MHNLSLATLWMTLATIAISSLPQLKAIDQLIRSRRLQDSDLHIEKKNTININTSYPVRIHETIKIPIRGSVYNNLITDDKHIYAMDGDILADLAQNSVVNSVRNQHTIVAYQADHTLVFRSLIVRQRLVEFEHILNLTHYNTKFIAFLNIGGMRARKSFLVLGSNGTISKYSHSGLLEAQTDLNINSPKWMIKVKAQLVVVSNTQVFVLDLRTLKVNPDCRILPGQEILDVIQADDWLYIQLKYKLLIYSVSRCLLIRHLDISPNSRINILGQLIIVSKDGSAYYLNRVNNFRMGSLPLKTSNQTLFITGRKTEHSSYIVLQELGTKKINLYQYVSKTQTDPGFDTKGFKIPMFILTIGVILFYNYKSRQGGKVDVQPKQKQSETEFTKQIQDLLEKFKQN